MRSSRKKIKKAAAYALGGVIGFLNGFFGGGGGTVAVPVLERVYGLPSKNAHATSVAVILPVTAASAIAYLVSGKTDWAMLGVCTLGSAAGGIVGSFLLKKATNGTVAAIFCAVMLVAGVKMLF